MKSKKKVWLYLRTNIINTDLVAGGSVGHTLGVIQGLLQSGHDVVCATSVMASLIKKCGVQKMCKLKNPSWLSFLRWRLNCLLSNIFFTWQTVRFLREHSVDVLYQRYSLLSVTGVIISRWKRIPLILEYNSSEAWKSKYWSKKRWFKLQWLVSFAEYINIHYAHHIVVVSQPLKDELIDRGVVRKKILVNPNGVDINAFNSTTLQEQRHTIRKKLDIEKSFVFGFVGTFGPWHGVNILAEIIPYIVECDSRVHFLLIGDGALKQSLETVVRSSGIEDHVTFTGLVAQHEAKKYLAACDAFIAPTQPNPDGTPFFGSPTKLFEYMSMAKPIITSDVGQIGQLMYPAVTEQQIMQTAFTVRDEVGITVSPSDLNAFVEALLWVLYADEKTRIAMGTNARNKAIKQYQWQMHVQNIVSFVERDKGEIRDIPKKII